MAEVEEDNDPHDLFTLLIPQQHSASRTLGLHRHLCRRPQDIPGRGIPIGLLPEPRVWLRNLDYRASILEDRKEARHAWEYARVPGGSHRMQSVH